jgi:hypothetical protein
MVDCLERVLRAGVADGSFATTEPREVARAVLTLCTTLVEPYAAMDLSLPEGIALYQRFAVGLAGV